jgi:hypothetical protein
MEIHETFDKVAHVGLDYGQGYQDGFWARRELDTKYQLVIKESVKDKSSIYLEQYS